MHINKSFQAAEPQNICSTAIHVVSTGATHKGFFSCSRIGDKKYKKSFHKFINQS